MAATDGTQGSAGLNAEVRRIWNGNAAFWDGYFGNGAHARHLFEPGVAVLVAYISDASLAGRLRRAP